MPYEAVKDGHPPPDCSMADTPSYDATGIEINAFSLFE